MTHYSGNQSPRGVVPPPLEADNNDEEEEEDEEDDLAPKYEPLQTIHSLC
jgi:hypothetical protein